jgi:hypothetical protein
VGTDCTYAFLVDGAGFYDLRFPAQPDLAVFEGNWALSLFKWGIREA